VRTVRNVKEHTTTQGLGSYTDTQLRAELDSRKTATPSADVYTRAGVRDEHRELFDDVVYALCVDGASITEVSTPSREGFIHGNAKNWVRNLGNLRAFKALHVTPAMTNVTHVSASTTAVPEEICKVYLQSRKEDGSGFTTKLTLVEAGRYDGHPFGIVQKPSGARWAIGDLSGNDKVQAYPMARSAYRKVEKATKGQRQLCDIVVFDPLG
jgi:hypothetical protein